MIKLKFFAKLREEVGMDELALSESDVPTTAALIPFLEKKFPQWQSVLSDRLLTAVNHEMISSNRALNDGDEVALFPPVTGG